MQAAGKQAQGTDTGRSSGVSETEEDGNQGKALPASPLLAVSSSIQASSDSLPAQAVSCSRGKSGAMSLGDLLWGPCLQS